MPSVCRVSRQNCCPYRVEANMTTNFQTVSADRLRNMIVQSELSEGMDGLLLLDCRPFIAFNQSHVRGSVNVHCPSILRRRCAGDGRLPLRTLFPTAEVRQRLAEGRCHPLVLYDDQRYGHYPTVMDENAPMAMFVAKCLQFELNLKNIFVLEGGFQDFRLVYSNLCSGIPASNSCSPPPRWSPTTACVFPRLSSSPAATGYTSPQDCPVEILPHLYLGDAHHASCRDILERQGITALLNVSHTCPNHFEDTYTYKCIPVEDCGTEDIAAFFQEAIIFIDNVKCSNGRVLVHCRAGISRSATICMAYLMATKRLRMEEAYEFVKLRRRIVSPNFSFMGQLMCFENQLFGAPTPAPSGGCSRSLSPIPAASPLLDPDPDSLTPSRGAAQQQSVFDFAPLGSPDSPIPCDSPTSATAAKMVGAVCIS